MLRIVVCDDEPVMTERISELIADQLTLAEEGFQIKKEYDGNELLTTLKDVPADLIFLDIDMPGVSGMEVASCLYDAGISSRIVFVTGHANLVFDSLKYHPYQFIRKEYLEKELPEVMGTYLKTRREENRVLEIIDSKGVHLIPIKQILYIEKVERKVSIVCKNNEEYLVWGSLKDYESEYSKSGLCRIHHGILVNLAYVNIIDSDFVILDDGRRLQMSRGRLKEVKDRYLAFMRVDR